MNTIQARPSADGMAVMRLVNVRDALVRGSHAEEGTKTFLEAGSCSLLCGSKESLDAIINLLIVFG